jgi:hypothetical protein
MEESFTREVLSCECELGGASGSVGCSDEWTRDRLEPGFVADWVFRGTIDFGPVVASA